MPLNIDIRKALIFAGERGEGLQKTHKLARYADEILVIPEGEAPAEIFVTAGLSPELNEKLVLREERRVPVHPFRAAEADLEALLIPGPGVFVVSDLADRRLNERISELCRARGILCNIIDTKDLCTVWFMSLIDTPHLSVALSSKGGAAFYSARLREELQPLVEDRDKTAGILWELREQVEPRRRFEVLQEVWKDPLFRFWIAVKAFSRAEKRARKVALARPTLRRD